MLSKHCHNLERIDMEDCSLITDATILNLKNGCPNLSSLALSHCENLTDNGLIELCNSHRERLEVIFKINNLFIYTFYFIFFII